MGHLSQIHKIHLCPYVGIIQIRLLWVEAELRFLSAGFHQLPVISKILCFLL